MSTPTTKLKRHGDAIRGAMTFDGTSYIGITIQSMTTAQRDALSPANGAIIYNTTNARLEAYSSGTWGQVSGTMIPQSEQATNNMILGTGAGAALTGAIGNTFLGISAGAAHAAGDDYDTCVGYRAGGGNITLNTVQGANVFLGYEAGFDSTGQSNVVIGYFAECGGTSAVGDHSGSNVIIGALAGANLVGNKAGQCTFIGQSAGVTTSGDASYCTVLGWNSSVNAGLTGAVAINGVATSDNECVIGGNSATSYIDNVYVGNGPAHATPQDFNLNATGGSGTDIAGADVGIAGGKGTGSGAGGSVLFKVAPAGASGSSLNSLVQVGEFRASDSSLQVTATRNSPELLQTLTDGATVNWDMDSGAKAELTLGGNRTMATPTNIKNGATYVIHVIQDGTGSRTLTWPAAVKWPGGTAPTLSTGAAAVDLFKFEARGGNLYNIGQSLNLS